MILSGVLVIVIFEAIIPDSFGGCDKQARFHTYKGARLLNSVIEKMSVPTIPDCIYKCIEKKTLCLSINYHHNNSDVNQCYLNNRTRRTAPAEDIKSDTGFTYYEKEPCIPNPCLFGGTCSMDNKTKEFECICRPRYKGLLCEIEPYGWSSRRPGKSCKDIKTSGDGVYDGEYWIDPEDSGSAMHVYCDMSHEEGGWLLVANVVLQDPASVPQPVLRDSYRDIANYNDNKTILSPTALRQIRQVTNFTQLRFHCRLASVGRTVHVITAANSTGYDVIDYFSAVHNNRPFACNSFYRGSDDDSLLAAQCHLWLDGKWGSGTRINNWRLNDHTFYVPGQVHWITMSYVTCDSRIAVNNPGDYWKIYVR